MRRPTPRPASFRGPKGPARPKNRTFNGAKNRPRNIYRRDAETALPGAGLQTLCGIKAACGACKYVNLDYTKSLSEKHAQGLDVLRAADVLGTARVLPVEPSPRPFGYRSLFKLAVRPAKPATAAPVAMDPEATEDVVVDRFAIGLFAQGSHDVVDMQDCPLHTAALRRLLVDLRSELNASALTPYNEADRTGQVRYIVARAAHLTGELMLTFVVTEPLKNDLRRLTDLLKRKGHKINVAYMNVNTGTGNAIFGPETVHVSGADRLRERMLDLDFEIGPTSFFQINPWQAINLYRRVEQIAGPATGKDAKPSVAWDLYCGLGQISLTLARQGYKVLGIEENPEATKAAADNAKKNKLEEKATFLAARVENAQAAIPDWARAPELIVANPSRRGLAPETRREIAGLLGAYPGTRFLYVSCDVETLARDLKELKAATGFHVRQIEAFDMFAQTADMEWLAVLTR